MKTQGQWKLLGIVVGDTGFEFFIFFIVPFNKCFISIFFLERHWTNPQECPSAAKDQVNFVSVLQAKML